MSQSCRVISRRQFTITSLGIPGTLLIEMTMKPPGGLEPGNPELVTGKHLIISLLFHLNKVMYKRFKT